MAEAKKHHSRPSSLRAYIMIAVLGRDLGLFSLGDGFDLSDAAKSVQPDDADVGDRRFSRSGC